MLCHLNISRDLWTCFDMIVPAATTVDSLGSTQVDADGTRTLLTRQHLKWPQPRPSEDTPVYVFQSPEALVCSSVSTDGLVQTSAASLTMPNGRAGPEQWVYRLRFCWRMDGPLSSQSYVTDNFAGTYPSRRHRGRRVRSGLRNRSPARRTLRGALRSRGMSWLIHRTSGET